MRPHRLGRAQAEILEQAIDGADVLDRGDIGVVEDREREALATRKRETRGRHTRTSGGCSANRPSASPWPARNASGSSWIPAPDFANAGSRRKIRNGSLRGVSA